VRPVGVEQADAYASTFSEAILDLHHIRQRPGARQTT
jgi:hypothetical protein